MPIITEMQFKAEMCQKLRGVVADGVTGPGRSGAVAAVYASYLLGIPFIPFGQPFPGKLLVIDTVSQSGRTIRKATRQTEKLTEQVLPVAIFNQCARLHFWFENQHE